MDYRPQMPPKDPARLPDFLWAELNRLAQALAQAQRQVELLELHAEPAKLRNGMVVFADGTDWKPNGTGTRGVYRYDAGTWVFLG